jgi:hypothetical protein
MVSVDSRFLMRGLYDNFQRSLGLGELAGIKESDAEPQLETARVGDAQPTPVSLSTRANKNLREFLKKRLKLRVRQIPEVTIDAVSIWQVPHLIYHVWRWCMTAFMVADVVIIISSVRGYSWFVWELSTVTESGP